MAKKVSFVAIGVVLVLAGLLAIGQWSLHTRSDEFCGFCNRPIKPELAVVAEVGGKERRVCCARCAITEAHQENKALRLISVTDYQSKKPIPPDQAWFVEDSRAMACDHDMAQMDETKRPQQLTFDRCSPGSFAFAHREDAQVFAQQNGGVIRRLPEMLGEVQPK
jgi:hypothetical protein